MASMTEMFNIARGKQQIQENEFSPYASATGALVKGIGGRLQDKAERPGKEADLFLKLLEIAEKQGAMKRQKEIDQRNQQMQQSMFGNLNTRKLRILTDETGKGVNTTASLMEKSVGEESITHETTRKYNSKTGYWDIESKPKKESTKRSISEEVDLHRQKKKVDRESASALQSEDPAEILDAANKILAPWKSSQLPNWQKRVPAQIMKAYNQLINKYNDKADNIIMPETVTTTGQAVKYLKEKMGYSDIEAKNYVREHYR